MSEFRSKFASDRMTEYEKELVSEVLALEESLEASQQRCRWAEAEVARLTPWVSKLQASVISVTARAERIEQAARAVISAEKEFRPVRPSLYHDPLKFALEALAAALPEGLSAATPECQMPAPAGETTRTTPGADMEAEPVTGPSPVGSASSSQIDHDAQAIARAIRKMIRDEFASRTARLKRRSGGLDV